MSNLTRAMMMGAAGASADPLYVDDVFSTYVYTGTSSAGHVITNGIDLSGEGGAVWVKNRGATDHHLITNEAGKFLTPSSTETEFTGNTGFISSFNSNGFTLGAGVRGSNNSDGQVSWTFRKAPGFFDVVTYTGNGSVQNISHSLGSVPGMIIVKNLTTASNWETYHRSTGATKKLELNENSAAGTNSGTWNDTEPTSSVFTVGTNNSANGASYKAYIFAHDDAQYGTDEDESIIKCGTYAGSGSTQNISLGFEAQWVMFKNITTAGDWKMGDIMRGMTDASSQVLDANASGAEGAAAYNFAPYSDGFTIGTNLGSINQSGQTYIYIAIRRPNKPPTAGTEVYKSVVGSDTIATATGFTVDMALSAYQPGNSYNHVAIDRLRDRSILTTSNNTAENANFSAAGAFATNDGMNARSLWGANGLYHFFRRASGFMDVVTYSGNATAGTAIAHNLEAVPEFIICKCRNQGAGFWCYHKDLSTNYAIRMDGSGNGSVAEQGSSNYWNSSTHSATTFTLGNYGDINGSNKSFISYLFATSTGISKIGSYTGTGNAINVDCGFSSGARLILIKRKDASGDWFIYNSASGIVSGNDPYLLLNTSAAEVTNTDYIDPLSSGFTVTSSAPAALNTNGGTYIFLAIA